MKINYIYHGDCSKVIATFPDNCIDLILCSPPYADLRSYNGFKIHPDKYAYWLYDKVKHFFRVLKNSGSIVLVIGEKVANFELHPYLDDFKSLMRKGNGRFIEDWIWVKTNPIPNSPINHRPMRCYEHCLWFAKTIGYKWRPDAVRTSYNLGTLKRYNREHKPDGYYRREPIKAGVAWDNVKPNPKGASPGNVIVGGKYNGRSRNHPAVYPAYLPSFFIKALTDEGDIILDPFAGSGTTGEEAQKLGRKWIMIDFIEKYCVAMRKRMYGKFPLANMHLK